MGNARFDDFIGQLLEFETEYNPDGSVRVERDPDDPGGTTKFGIDQRAHPGVDIPRLTLADAKQIYFADWTRMPCDELPRPLGELLFDIAQNGGPGPEWLQKALGVDADGFIGSKTIAAASAIVSDSAKIRRVIDYICDQRELRFRRLVDNRPRSKKYLNGWIRRAEAMRRWAQNHPPLFSNAAAPVSA